MFEFNKILFISIVLGCVIDFSRNAALSNQELKKYKQLIEGQGLYSPEDDITILTANNFKNSIYGKNHALLIEFYNSWCGFCQRFAPSWKALGSDVKGWKDIVTIAAIDCNDEDNAPICRDFEIMAYPTLRYIHENYQEGPGRIGSDVQKGEDVYSHKLFLIKKIIQEQREGRGKQFPNILPYIDSDASRLFDDVPSGTKYVFLILEQPDSMIGPEIAFDLHEASNIVIKYSLANNTALERNVRAVKLPTIFVKGDDGTQEFLSEFVNTREGIRIAIREFLRPRSIQVPEVTTKKNIFTGKWIEADIPDMSALMEARETENLKKKIKQMGDVVFQADLETALRYSLKREIALVKSISGEKLEALTKYLKVLVKYFPFGSQGQQFLTQIKDKVAAVGDSVSGADIAQWVSKAEEDGRQVFSSPPQWLACRGSSATFRGYPCGLWKMFHFLTVAAAEQNVGNEDAYPREILDAMLGYIKHFFGCQDCSQHFQEMAVEKDMKSVSSLDSAVLWLWMAHNTVNKRLQGDATEDPEFPKIQFPAPERCPTCKSSDKSWIYPEVLLYLKHVYSSINVRYIGSDTRVLHMGLEGSATNNGSSPYFFKRIDTTRVQEKDVRT
ncbi:hypothetical protein ILUMI_07894 [Ignelater luminosus]|uniref:Sulfhydryl oxidase n=1 Tax=Ignelater luminosus TaxID=2038154 RepID=A0A8K0D2M9_IGNLU|nr:hypothetical protein ILUMI_07894 [Ignelater luminosus]